MTLIIRDLRLLPGQPQSELLNAAAARLKIPAAAVSHFKLSRLSLDARKKSDIHYCCTVEVDCDNEPLLLRSKPTGVALLERQPEEPFVFGSTPPHGRIAVIGTGPCGLFAGYTLAVNGYKPLLIERGKSIERRDADVLRLLADGTFNDESNVLFGEGGAGTYSDGKLTTRIKDPLSAEVLRIFAKAGADASVEYSAKPHIGTDALKKIIVELRKHITELGGEYLFETRVTGFEQSGGALTALKTTSGEIPVQACILAAGHSARDIYPLLLRSGALLQPKAFAVGVRIEHPQELINAAQYGDAKLAETLGAAEYALTAKTRGGRGVYTFCMCPGGEVVCSASESNMLAVNGMSENARSGKNANSALVVQVFPEDFGSAPLDGVEFQRRLEKAAFAGGGGSFYAPVQTVGSFLGKNAKSAVTPTYKPGVKSCELRGILPKFVYDGIEEALPEMGRRLKGFDDGGAIMTAVESRTSAPVRIARNEELQVPSIAGLYPAGEGAGWAGGIVSAAVDGIKCARAIMRRYSNEVK